jgi:hypothetical protein
MQNRIYTIPDLDFLISMSKSGHSYMRPNLIPHAVVSEGTLNDKDCDDIIELCMAEDPYDFHGCDAITRECSRPLHSDIFRKVLKHTYEINRNNWNFALDTNPGAWFQTYDVGSGYALHTGRYWLFKKTNISYSIN